MYHKNNENIELNVHVELFKGINALADTQSPMPKIGRVTNKITFLGGIDQLSEHVRIEDIADLDGAEITIMLDYSEQRLILPFMPDSNWTIVLCGNLSEIRINSMNGKHTLTEHLNDRIQGMQRRQVANQDALNFATLFLSQSDSNFNPHGRNALDKYIPYWLESIVLIHRSEIEFVEYTLGRKEILNGISPIKDDIMVIDADGNEAIVSDFQGSALQALQNVYDDLKENQKMEITQALLDATKLQAWKLVSTEKYASHALFYTNLEIPN